MSSMFQVVICAERSRGMRSISFTCHLEAFQREDSWGSFRFSVRRASNLRKPVGDLRFRTHQFPMETLKSREFNYSWNFISISRSMSCHDINILFFSFFFFFYYLETNFHDANFESISDSSLSNFDFLGF